MDSLCKLCGTKPPIPNSHVLAKLGYRRYVANQNRGGSSIKLDTLREDSRQLTRKWFCQDCEKLFGEDYAARFLDKLKRVRTDTHYDGPLLRFVVSCSWRTCLYTLEDESNFANRKQIVPACKAWKAYLLDETQSIAHYTQHAFVIRDPTVWDERMGMQVAYIHNLVFTQIGPLICFGLLARCVEQDRWALSQSMVRSSGGALPNLISTKMNFALTEGMLIAMDHADMHCNLRVRDFANSRNRVPTRWSERKQRLT